MKTPVSGFKHLRADGSFVVELDGIVYEQRLRRHRGPGRKPKAASVSRLLLRQAQQRAAAAKLPAPTITEEWINTRLALGACEASRLGFAPGVRGPTVARKDRTQPYTPENCWVINRGTQAALTAFRGDVEDLAAFMTAWLSARNQR